MHLKRLLFLIICLIASGPGAHLFAGEYMQLPGVIHVHSTFSSGKYSIGELVSRAEGKGVEVLLLTDTYQSVMEYGLIPFHNLIKKRKSAGRL